jgi:hypothetical protein
MHVSADISAPISSPAPALLIIKPTIFDSGFGQNSGVNTTTPHADSGFGQNSGVNTTTPHATYLYQIVG